MQQTLVEGTFEQYRKPTRRERVLDEMNRVVPYGNHRAGLSQDWGLGRPLVGVERMLRLHCLQQCFNLSDPAVEQALYDSRAMQQFVGIDLGREPVPDETTVCKFRHLLETHQLGPQLFARIGVRATRFTENGSSICASGSCAAANNPSISMNVGVPRRRYGAMGMPRKASVWTAWSPGIDGHAPR